MSAQNNTQRIFILVIVAVFFLTSVAITISVIIDAARNKDAETSTTASESADLQKQLDQLQADQTKTVQPAEGATMELQSTDTVPGTGAEAAAGKSVTVHYTGTLKDGTKFDSSVDRGQPFTFNLGGGQVIKGWDQGVVGMKVGGKRTLVIPAALAYGEQSPSPTIPPNSDLVFTIELLNVQ